MRVLGREMGEVGKLEGELADLRLRQCAHWSPLGRLLWRMGSCGRLKDQLVRPLGRCLRGAWVVLERVEMVRRRWVLLLSSALVLHDMIIVDRSTIEESIGVVDWWCSPGIMDRC